MQWLLRSVPTSAGPSQAMVAREGVAFEAPASVHSVLIDAGLLSDPFIGDNEEEQHWAGRSDWVFEARFDCPEDMVQRTNQYLVLSGIDSIATVELNGNALGMIENVFRRYQFRVNEILLPRDNLLTLLFEAPVPTAERKQEERYLHHTGIDTHRISGVNHLRKAQYSFGWDWGPKTPTCGVYDRPVLWGYDAAAIESVNVHSDVTGSTATVEIDTEFTKESAVAVAGGTLRINAEIMDDEGKIVASTVSSVNGASHLQTLRVEKPNLWWTNGLGGQPLYTLQVTLTDDNDEIDRRTIRFGIRTIELLREPDEWGESFGFRLNGVPVFVKGANWIPADSFWDRVDDTSYRRLLESARSAHMNMIRVWGGGYYEKESFYDICDQLGILVWQDFMFACSAYPSDQRFNENVRAEATEQVKRLRNHPSLALWCGNNELEQIPGLLGDGNGAMSWEDYSHLFDVELRTIVEEFGNGAPYWPSSPHTPPPNRCDVQDATAGDAHLWDVWHGGKPFEWYRSCLHRFNSEFGFQSLPDPATVAFFAEPTERNLSSYTMDFHQRSHIGNEAIMRQLMSWFRMPSGI